jgi:hypothetical protein
MAQFVLSVREKSCSIEGKKKLLTWQTPEHSTDYLQSLIGTEIRSAEAAGRIKLPDLRKARDLAIAMDYSGEHSESNFQCLTFLLADAESILGHWNSERKSIRQKHLRDGRRHAFKKLSERCRQQALVPFLAASSTLNGIVFSVVIDKKLESSMLGYSLDTRCFQPLVLAKLLKIALFGSILVGGLATSNQNLAWITDDDAIIGNSSMEKESAELIVSMLHQMCPFGFSRLQLLIAGRCNDELLTEDLCSIPDLVGGAVTEYFNSIDTSTVPTSTNLQTLVWDRLSTKSHLINLWLGSAHPALSIIICLAREHAGNLQLSFTSPFAFVGSTGASPLWLPLDKGWQRSARVWRQ